MILYSMRIGIIGAGFTGLSAALKLQEQGHDVCIFEKEKKPGGLAIGFQGKNWEWSLEKHYHHIFSSDYAIRSLADRVQENFVFYRPNTSSLINEEILQLDSPLQLLFFPKLSLIERIRMAGVLGYLKYLADWKKLEQYKAHAWLKKMLGEKGYMMLWEPLLRAKFGEEYYKEISLAWFWARIKARSTELGYPEKGFQHFADTLDKNIKQKKGSITYNCTVTKLEQRAKKHIVHFRIDGALKQEEFDYVLVTVPNIIFAAITPSLSDEYKKKLRDFKVIGAINLVLELSKPMLPNNVYWLNICEKKYPFLAVVEHTNLINTAHYGNHHIVYVGKYAPHGHRYFSLTKEDLLKEYDPYLKKLNPNYKKSLLDVSVFHAPFGQPVVTTNFSKKILPFETPIAGLYLANMQQVYPWDRGTNFAVETGERVAELIHGKIKE